MATLFTSDTHFGHKNIIEYCNRPFSSVEHQDNVLVENWNAKVKPDDVVYHAGDFAFGSGCFWKSIRARLNGKIHLILGNHDERVPMTLFESVRPYVELSIHLEEGGVQKMVIFHYGMRTWHHDLRGTWHLYGHSHAQLPPYGKSMDIGVDNPLAHYSPFTFDELRAILDQREIGQHPQFDKFNVPPQF